MLYTVITKTSFDLNILFFSNYIFKNIILYTKNTSYSTQHKRLLSCTYPFRFRAKYMQLLDFAESKVVIIWAVIICLFAEMKKKSRC